MRHRISIPVTADRFYYESKETDTLWDMVKMLENKLQTSHHFISLYKDHYLSQNLTYGCYYTPLSDFDITKWYVTVKPDTVRLFDKKYQSDNGKNIIYDFNDFEEIVNDSLSSVLYKVSTNDKIKDRNVEISFSTSEPQLTDIVKMVLPKMIYSYHEEDEMGKVHIKKPTYNVVKISIDQTEKKISNDLLNYIQHIINEYDNDSERVEKGKTVFMSFYDAKL